MASLNYLLDRNSPSVKLWDDHDAWKESQS
jgi:hypothetical protein